MDPARAAARGAGPWLPGHPRDDAANDAPVPGRRAGGVQLRVRDLQPRLDPALGRRPRQQRSICEKLDVDRVDLVGYSMGGLIGLHCGQVPPGSPLRPQPRDDGLTAAWHLGQPRRRRDGRGDQSLGLADPAGLALPRGSADCAGARGCPHAADPRRLRCPVSAAWARSKAWRARDYIMLAGGHSSLVVAEHFYQACRESPRARVGARRGLSRAVPRRS